MKNKAVVVVGTAGLILGGLWVLEPKPTTDSIQENLRQSQVEQLSDSQERVNDGHRDSGQDALEAELSRRNGDHIPDPERGPRIRIRP